MSWGDEQRTPITLTSDRHAETMEVAEAAEAKDDGALLASHVERLEREVHQGEKQTIIHGDAKSANFFYKANGAADGGLDVGIIDFQWCVKYAYIFCIA